MDGGLVYPSIIDNVESAIVLDKPAYKPGEKATLILLLRGIHGSSSIRVRIVNHSDIDIHRNVYVVDTGLKVIPIEHQIPERSGFYELILEVNGKHADRIKYIVDDPAARKPLYYSAVWHNHQAPNYTPDMRIHSPWAYTHVWENELAPYGRGAYHYHAYMLKKHAGYKATYNLSPSLLYQWVMLLERGVEFLNGRSYTRFDHEAEYISEILEIYRESLSENRIDVLTSLYAHTIAGYLVDYLDMQDIVKEEIEAGLEVTRTVFKDYTPKGIWIPEMAFSMKLIPICKDLGLEYTILDDENHLKGAEGDKVDQYRPYILLDSTSRKHIFVFFRDTHLSNILGFKNNYISEIHAWRSAYEYSYLVMSKWLERKNKLLVVALDGENWLIFSKSPGYTAFFFDKIIEYLERLDASGYIKQAHLREILETLPVNNVIYNIPTNSWLGTFKKWNGEIKEHRNYWIKSMEVYAKIKCYENMIRGKDDKSTRARWALWHALDSDYWWAEFWYPSIISTWLEYAEKIVSSEISKVKISNIHVKSELYEGATCDIGVEIENKLEREVYLTLKISGLDIKTLDESKTVVIKPNSSQIVDLRIQPLRKGHQYLAVSVLSNDYILASKSILVEVKPYSTK